MTIKSTIEGILRAYPIIMMYSTFLLYIMTSDFDYLYLFFALWIGEGINYNLKYNFFRPIFGDNIPFLGICLGLQCAVIEFARNVCGISDANSSEFSQTTKNPVIDILPNQNLEKDDVGASMRLGTYPCKIKEETMASYIYNNEIVYERHRHRYEVNNKFRNQLEENGLIFSGVSPDEDLVEMIEIKDHPYFVASQFHPEFKSRPWEPAPMFNSFIEASKKIEIPQKTIDDEAKVRD